MEKIEQMRIIRSGTLFAAAAIAVGTLPACGVAADSPGGGAPTGAGGTRSTSASASGGASGGAGSPSSSVSSSGSSVTGIGATDNHGEVAGAEVQTVGNMSCQTSGNCLSDCTCCLGYVCSGGPAGVCAYNPESGFAPQPPTPFCVATCQCTDGYCYSANLSYNAASSGECQAGPVPMVPVSGSWYNPERSGWGLGVSNSNSNGVYGNIEVTWYTFTASAVPIWYYGSLAPTPNGRAYSGTLYSNQYLPASRSTNATSHGSMTLALTSATAGTFSWVLDHVPGSQPVQRLVFGGAGSAPRLTGQWFADTPCPTCPLGEIPTDVNLFFDVQGNTVGADVALYDSDGNPTWVYGSAPASSAGFTLSLLRVTGNNLCPSCNGPPSTSFQTEGSLGVSSINAADSSAKFVLTLPVSYEPRVSSTQEISRQTD